MSAIPYTYNDYHLQVRQDFMLSATPVIFQESIEYYRQIFNRAKITLPDWYLEFKERLQEGRRLASKTGFKLSSRSKQRVRAASYALFLSENFIERENLRFVTFTFPELPESLKSKPKHEQDKALHKIFLKFVDNERKNYNLRKWVWVNELQTENKRNVLHYHSLFSYGQTIDYYNLNLRFVNHLRRNGFNIFAYFFRHRRFMAHRQSIVQMLEKSDYATLEANKEYTRYNQKILNENGETELKKVSVFFQPVDIEKPKADNIGKVSSYLSKYISKAGEGEKIACRRFGCSRKLIPAKEDLFKDFTKKELLQIFSVQTKKDVQARKKPYILVNKKDKKEMDVFLYPPKWDIWKSLYKKNTENLSRKIGKLFDDIGFTFAPDPSDLILQI